MSTVLHHGVVDASPPPSDGDREATRAGAAQVLLAVSLAVSFVLAYLFVLSDLEQGRAQNGLYQQLRSELAEGVAPVAAPIEAGHPVALLSIPGAEIADLVVVEGTRAEQLQDGPGHVLGSVLPGQQGTSTLAGRSLSFGAPFEHVPSLEVGDPIRVTTGQGVFGFAVIGVRRAGDPTPPALAPGGARLVLKTTARSSGLGGLQASELVFVDADLVEGTAAAPGARATPDTRDPMAGSLDGPTLALLALSLQLLLGSLAGVAWAWQRWSPAAAWIAGAPAVLASLWLTCSLATRLLPALI